MKFAICNELYDDWSFDKAFAHAAEPGYRGVEIAPFTIDQNAFNVSADRRKQVREMAATNGLEVIGLHWLLAKTEGFHLTHPDQEVRQRTGDYVGELARLCRDPT